MSIIVAGTGHRPQKIVVAGRSAYDERVFRQLVAFASKVIERLSPTEVISGMALGWDMALATAAVECDVPFAAYVPFVGQESVWPRASQEQYRALMARASRVRIICDGGYAAWKMQRRNEAMVEDCERLLALWDGTAGGTGNCVAFAERQQRPIVQLWSSWQKFIA